MKILNLGCGAKTCSNPNVINIDWSIYLRLYNNRVMRGIMPLFINGERLQRFNAIPPNIMVHDLSKGLLFESDSVDVAYHSHLLEHLDWRDAKSFLREVKRVLKPGGIHRIVVPDFEYHCKKYLDHIVECDYNPEDARNHDKYIAALIEQSVRKEAYSTSRQKPFRRFLENLIIGDARKRGETHQWMYDRISLKEFLISTGYKSVWIQNAITSLIKDWNNYLLDVDEDGNEHNLHSLYMEAQK